MKVVKIGSANFKKLVNRNSHFKKRIAESVKNVLDDVRLEGDEAIVRYTRKFDKIKMKVKIIDRIKFVNAWIAKRKYYIVEHCKHHIREMESWSFDSKGKPEDYSNHTIDETSYEWIPERDRIK